MISDPSEEDRRRGAQLRELTRVTASAIMASVTASGSPKLVPSQVTWVLQLG